MTWLLGHWVVGYFFNEFVMASGNVVPTVIVGLLVLSVASARAHDARRGERAGVLWNKGCGHKRNLARTVDK